MTPAVHGSGLELQPGNTLVVAGADGQALTTTWGELEALDLPPVSAVFSADHLQAARAAWAHATSQRQHETLVAARTRLDPMLGDELLNDGFTIVKLPGLAADGTSGPEIDQSPNPRGADREVIWLLTSGTTGRPKRVAHSLASLTTVQSNQPGRVWLCPYTPGAYAWWQVVTLGLFHPDNGLVMIDPAHTEDWPLVAREHGVNAASGTPTFWRQALMRNAEVLREIDFEQITLGGEPVDQAIIDLLAQTFPKARVSWIYASSEAGASIAVHDGKAGFPQEWLDNHRPGRPQLSLAPTPDGADELVIASPHRGAGVAAELHTGDRVEVRDGRVHIVGRLGRDEINVGGSKVSAAQVREVLLGHPSVRWVAVKGRRAPMVGTVVQADVVTDGQVDETELSRFAAARLADYAVPRRFRFLDEIPITESLKSDA